MVFSSFTDQELGKAYKKTGKKTICKIVNIKRNLHSYDNPAVPRFTHATLTRCYGRTHEARNAWVINLPTTRQTPHPNLLFHFFSLSVFTAKFPIVSLIISVPHLCWKNDTGSTEVDFDCPEMQKLLLNLFISGFIPKANIWSFTWGRPWTSDFRRGLRSLAGFSANSTPCKVWQLDLSEFLRKQIYLKCFWLWRLFFHKSSWAQWLLPRRRKRLFVRILLPDFSNVSLMRVLDFRRTFIGNLGRNFSNITLVRVLTERYFHLQIFGKILSYARHGLGTCRYHYVSIVCL